MLKAFDAGVECVGILKGWKGFIENLTIPLNIAEEIFGWIEKCQRYSFNKCLAGDTIIHKFADKENLEKDI